MPRDRDPLALVILQGGMPRININHPALAETLRAFRSRVQDSGGGRLLGKAIQDYFASAPYGWSKDAVRYLFAAALVAGEIELHTGGEVLKTAGPAAADAFRSTVAFNRVGVGLAGYADSLRDIGSGSSAIAKPVRRNGASAGRSHQPGGSKIYPGLNRTLRIAAGYAAFAGITRRELSGRSTGRTRRHPARGCQRCTLPFWRT